MAPVSAAQLAEALRPLAEDALGEVIARSPGEDMPVLPTRHVPQFAVQPDGSVQTWVDPDVDWSLFARQTYIAIQNRPTCKLALTLFAQGLGTELQQAASAQAGWSWTAPGEALVAFLGDVLREYFNATTPRAALDPQERVDSAVDRAAGRLSRFLNATELGGTLVVPLLRAAIASDKIIVDRSTRIMDFTEQHKREFWAHHGSRLFGGSPADIVELVASTHCIVIDVYGPPLGPWNWVEAQQRVQHLLLALKLMGPGGLDTPWMWMSFDDEFADYLTLQGAGGGLVTQRRQSRVSGNMRVDKGNSRRLRALCHHVTRAQENPALALALRRFEMSYDRMVSEDRLIDYWIAFEALYAPDQTTELSYRVSLRIARALGKSGEERVSLFEAMKRSYDWRSRIVHGGGPPSPKQLKKIGRLEDSLDATESALRSSLSQWVDPHLRPNTEQLDHELLA